MAKSRSETSRYPSNFGGGHVTAAQYCTEQLCALIAHQNKQTLPQEFWKADPKWEKFFRQQAKPVNDLNKKYGAEAVVAALKDKRCARMRSFRATFIIEPVIRKKLREIKVQQAQPLAEAVEPASTTAKPRKPSKPRGQSLFGRLREIEHGKEEDGDSADKQGID